MHQVVMQLMRSQRYHKNLIDALGGNVVSEITKTQEMHQVAMQSMSSQLRKKPKRCIRWWCSQWNHTWEKNPEDDNESRASQLVIIFCIFLSVVDDGKPPWLVVISLFFFRCSKWRHFLVFFSSAKYANEPSRLTVIYYIWAEKQ
jgi:hypothetical protein